MDAANITIPVPSPASIYAGSIIIPSRRSPALSMTKADMMVSIINVVFAFSALL